MKKLKTLLAFMTAGLLLCPPASQAEDTDLYSGLSSAGNPNVLIILDNAANFSSNSSSTCTYTDAASHPSGGTPSMSGTVAGMEQCAIYNIVYSLPVNNDPTQSGRLNLGIMVYNGAGIKDYDPSDGLARTNCTAVNNIGGCLVFPITEMNQTKKDILLKAIRSWTLNDMKSNGQATGQVMQEAWAYFGGTTGISGRNYSAIKPSAGCQKNFVIFIANAVENNGTPGDGGSADVSGTLTTAIDATTFSADGATNTAKRAELKTNITLSRSSTEACGAYTMGTHSNSSGLYADEWARFMYQGDLYSTLDGNQGVTTFGISVLGSNCRPDWPALVKSMATTGGGAYYETDVDATAELQSAIARILNDVQAVNSVFSSASLPVSVNTQGSYLNQIFMGMFRPDDTGRPRWAGNLKQYQFVYDSSTGGTKMADSTGADAISTIHTGFISSNAISFWTTKDTSAAPDSTGGYWKNQSNGAGLTYDSPDGELVEKGGVAQGIRTRVLTTNYSSTPASPRSLYTYCPSGASCVAALTDSSNAFATTNAGIGLGTSTISIVRIDRVGTTATVETASAHGLAAADGVVISGSNQSDYNGTKTVASVSDSTHFTFLVPDYPPYPATGSFTASKVSSPRSATLARTAGTQTVTVTSAGHGFVGTDRVAISGATPTDYNGSFTISNVTANTFQYTEPTAVGPATPAGSFSKTGSGGSAVYSATATVGATSRYIDLVSNSGITRSGSTVTVKTTANHGFVTGNTVTLAGVADASNNAIASYNGTFALTKITNSTFTITVAETPITPPTGTITASLANAAQTVTALTRTGTTARATVPSHGFITGDTISIGGTPAANEGAYAGSYTITKVDDDTFEFTITTSPATPATGTMTAIPSTAINRTSLINWIRGEDNYGDEASPGSPYTVRPSVHGDVLHSRPIVVNYGSTHGVIAFYGANDGVFRAVKGAQTGTGAGSELWGFIPTEFFATLNRQRINSPTLQFPSTPTSGITPIPKPKDYFIDGPTGLYQVRDAGTGDITTAYLYLGMRRGGRFLYALDVSSPTAPAFLWKKSNTDTDMGELGQTWSLPQPTKVRGWANPVLIFGGGYSGGATFDAVLNKYVGVSQDAEPPTADTMGRAIYILDAITGNLLWKAEYQASGTSDCTGTVTKAVCLVTGMDYSIPSDVKLVDRDGDGYTDRLYVGDMGGNMWRVDVEPGGGTTSTGNTPDTWRVYKTASVGCDTGPCPSGTTPRKIFYPPSVLFYGRVGATGSVDAVLFGTGDREHPLYSTTTGSSHLVNNRFYMIKDTKNGKNAGSVTTVTETSLFDATSNPYLRTSASYSTTNGYYISFASGEKAVNAPATAGGFTFFGTNQGTAPSATSCVNLGNARGYRVQPLTAAGGYTLFDGGGLPPSPVTGMVTISLGGGATKTVPFVIGGGDGGQSGSLGSGKTGGGYACDPAGATLGGSDSPGATSNCEVIGKGTKDCSSALGSCGLTAGATKSRIKTYWYREK